MKFWESNGAVHVSCDSQEFGLDKNSEDELHSQSQSSKAQSKGIFILGG